MKNKLFISLFAAAAAAFSSCQSDIDNFMVDDTIGLMKGGLVDVEVYTGLDDPYHFYAIKAGKGFQSCEVSVAVEPELIAEYNATAVTPLTELPADCYSLTVSTLYFGEDDYKKPFQLTWNRDRLAEVLAVNPNVAIPVRMSVNGNLNIDEKRLTTLLRPVLAEPKVSLRTYGFTTGLMPTRKSATEQVVYMEVRSNFIAQQDIDYEFEIDPTLIDEYNEKNGTEFVMLPEEAYRINLSGWTLKKYLNSSRFNFTIVRTALIPDDGPSKFGKYMLPLRLKKLSSSNIDTERNYVLYTVEIIASNIDKKGWSIVSCNSSVEDDPGASAAIKKYVPAYLIDGKTTTQWRSIWTVPTELPIVFDIDMGRNHDLYKVLLDGPKAPDTRYNNSKSGTIQASLDGETWTKIADWNWGASYSVLSCEFEVQPTTARYIRLTIDEVFRSLPGVTNPYATALSQIRVYGD